MILIFLITSLLISNVISISVNDIKVWGPGLEPDKVILPARYIFLETKSNETILKDFNFYIYGTIGNIQCRIRSSVLDRKDGTYIFRYKLYEPCDELQIKILFRNKHISGSPYSFNNILSEHCNCPKSIEQMFENYNCKDVPQQIINDLKEFPRIKWSKLKTKMLKEFDNPGAVSLCHYVIKNNVVSRKCYGKYTGFKMFMDSILGLLSRIVILPDTEFFVNLGDWPLSTVSNKYPILSWCSSDQTFDIIMPTYDITESTLENLGRVTLDILSAQGKVENIWQDRISKAFFRGRDSNKYRLKLMEISRENPELFNVSLTNYFFYRDKEQEYGKTPHISFFKFFDYKYLVNIDGTVAAYRLPYLLAGGSLVLKQDSVYYEHFYKDLKPGVHYVPIKKDLSDLVEKIEWAKENDDEAKRIAQNGQQFVVENLLPENILCYYTHLINEYSKKLEDAVESSEDMEVIEQHAQNKKCKCSLDKDEL